MTLSKRAQLIDELIMRNSQMSNPKEEPQEQVYKPQNNSSQEDKFNMLVSMFNDKDKKTAKDKNKKKKAFIKYFTENFQQKIDNKLFA